MAIAVITESNFDIEVVLVILKPRWLAQGFLLRKALSPNFKEK